MYSCPACCADNVAQRTTCACGADLTLLQKLDGLGNAWFNRALDALAAGTTGRAIEWLAACCAARPTDAAASRALAKAWAQLGRWQEAADALDRAAHIDPQALDLQSLRQALQDASVNPNATAREATDETALVADRPERTAKLKTEKPGRRGRGTKRRSKVD